MIAAVLASAQCAAQITQSHRRVRGAVAGVGLSSRITRLTRDAGVAECIERANPDCSVLGDRRVYLTKQARCACAAALLPLIPRQAEGQNFPIDRSGSWSYLRQVESTTSSAGICAGSDSPARSDHDVVDCDRSSPLDADAQSQTTDCVCKGEPGQISLWPAGKGIITTSLASHSRS